MTRRSHADDTGRDALTLLLVLCVAALVSPPAAATVGPQASTGSPARVEVRVRTGDGTPVADRRVTLEIHDPRQAIDRRTSTTSDDGVAVFEEVPAGPGFHVRALVDHGGVSFPGPPTPVGAGQTATVPVTVWETTSEGRPLHVDRLHLIVQVAAPELSRVAQVMVVRNVSEQAYLGEVTSSDGRRAGLVIPVPDTAVQVQAIPPPNSELDPEAVATHDAGLLDLRPVPPGVRNVAVSYEIRGDADGQLLELTLPYPTRTVDLLVHGAEEAGLEVEAPGFDEQQPRALGQQGTFANWTSDVVPAGETITIRFTTPAWRLDTASWALLALSAALLLAVAASLLAGRLGDVRAADREEILRRIARLDRDHEAARLTDSVYYARRAAALEELLALDRAAGRREEG